MMAFVLSMHYGEAFFSLLIRHSRFTSEADFKKFGRCVIQDKPAFRDFPVAASEYEKECGCRFTPQADLLRNHSAAYYFSSTMPEYVRLEQLRYCVRNAALLARISIGSNWVKLRFCPTCADEQYRQYHYSWWLRDHQLPLTTNCIKHQALLAVVPLNFDELPLPHEYTKKLIKAESVPASAWMLATEISLQEKRLTRPDAAQYIKRVFGNGMIDVFTKESIRMEQEAFVLLHIRNALIKLAALGFVEPLDDWDRVKVRTQELLRKGIDYSDPAIVALMLTAYCLPFSFDHPRPLSSPSIG